MKSISSFLGESGYPGPHTCKQTLYYLIYINSLKFISLTPQNLPLRLPSKETLDQISQYMRTALPVLLCLHLSS
jgi:hypothetical protein